MSEAAKTPTVAKEEEKSDAAASKAPSEPSSGQRRTTPAIPHPVPGLPDSFDFSAIRCFLNLEHSSSLEDATAAACSNEFMEDPIWNDFPKDLFEAVIARLPIATFFFFRTVCRKWNSLLTSQCFSQQCAQVKHAEPWFYTATGSTHEHVNTGAMYDSSLKKWHHPRVPALQTELIVLPVASAGGLICFVDSKRISFYVSNPLTRSFKELPATSAKVRSPVAVGMTMNGCSASSGYKILWVGCEGEYEVFDSAKNSWIRPGIMPSSVKLPLALNSQSQAVSVDGTLYFLRSEPDGMLSYEMEKGMWKQYVLPLPPHLSDHTLAESGGRIMLVGLLTNNAAKCMCIWELQKMTLLWKEVDRTPNIWCLGFYGRHVNMTCLGNKGLRYPSGRDKCIDSLLMIYPAGNGSRCPIVCRRVPGRGTGLLAVLLFTLV